MYTLQTKSLHQEICHIYIYIYIFIIYIYICYINCIHVDTLIQIESGSISFTRNPVATESVLNPDSFNPPREVQHAPLLHNDICSCERDSDSIRISREFSNLLFSTEVHLTTAEYHNNCYSHTKNTEVLGASWTGQMRIQFDAIQL